MPTELKIITAQELQETNPQPPQFIIDQILPAGFVVFAAPPKYGKSWLCLSIADAVVDGQPFWGFQTSRGSVLYLALEDSGYRLNSRLKGIGSRMPGNFFFSFQADRIGNGLIDQLKGWADKHPDAKLIIIDTIARIKGAGIKGLNAYESDTLMFSPLQQFAITRGICILGIFHFSKTKNIQIDDPFERISGSTGALGVADAAWILYGKRGEDQTLRTTGRDIDDASYSVRFKDSTWKLLGDTESLEKQAAIDEYKRSPLVKVIRSLIREQNYWEGSAAELMNEIWKREKSAPFKSKQELGKQLNKYRQLLEETDGIAFYKNPGGRKGRDYRFSSRSANLI